MSKVPLTLTISPAGRDWLDELALAHQASRSLVVRAALQVARAHQAELEKRLTELKELS